MTTPDATPNDDHHASSPDDASGKGAPQDASTDDASSKQASDDDTYRRVREDFDGLNFEKQATFLVDAAVSLLARGIETAGRAIASELDEMAEKRRKKGETAGPFGGGEPSKDSPRSSSTSSRDADGDRSDPLSTPDAPSPSDEPPHDTSTGPRSGTDAGPGR